MSRTKNGLDFEFEFSNRKDYSTIDEGDREMCNGYEPRQLIRGFESRKFRTNELTAKTRKYGLA